MANGHIVKLLEDILFLDACGEITNEQMRSMFKALGYHIESDWLNKMTLSGLASGEIVEIEC